MFWYKNVWSVGVLRLFHLFIENLMEFILLYIREWKSYFRIMGGTYGLNIQWDLSKKTISNQDAKQMMNEFLKWKSMQNKKLDWQRSWETKGSVLQFQGIQTDISEITSKLMWHSYESLSYLMDMWAVIIWDIGMRYINIGPGNKHLRKWVVDLVNNLFWFSKFSNSVFLVLHFYYMISVYFG